MDCPTATETKDCFVYRWDGETRKRALLGAYPFLRDISLFSSYILPDAHDSLLAMPSLGAEGVVLAFSTCDLYTPRITHGNVGVVYGYGP